MRTTLDLSDDLLREAKIAAVNRGVTLRQLITNALERELHGGPDVVPAARRVNFPIIPPSGHGILRITPEMVRDAELEDDLRRGGFHS